MKPPSSKLLNEKIVKSIQRHMNYDESNSYINKKCYDCCQFKKENMELYKLNVPSGTDNDIIVYALDEENECENCKTWRDNQAIINCLLRIKRRHNRNVEDDICIFLTVYNILPYKYVRALVKFGKKHMK